MNNQDVLPTEIIKTLYKKNPKFHGRENAGSKSYAIKPQVLEWIINNVPKDSNTLETGCGYSTVILSSISKKHTVISPFPQEHTLIREWCNNNGVSTNHVDMIPEISQDVVPALKCENLDFILIDGDHAFPAPFIDWYYTADKLRVDGFIAIDDTHIPTGKILRDFLLKEIDRWLLVTEIGNTAVFKRISHKPVAKGVLFIEQPYCKIPRKKLSTRLIDKIKRLIKI